MTLTVGSLFSGIGGLELGLERAGMRIVWQVESDDYARTILRKHWPDVPKFSDVRLVGAHCLEPADLICGGFPCQDLSVAGKQVGLEGERSGLWFEYLRIIRELRPRYIVVENVPPLLWELGAVLGPLAEGGYDAEWDCIPAAALGAPHRRDRVFVVGVEQVRFAARLPQCDCCGEPYCPECERHFFECRHPGPSSWAETLADPDGEGWEGRSLPVWGDDAGERLARARRESFARNWSAEPDVGRVVNGLPARVDRLRGLGNSVVPAVAEWIGRCIVAHAEAP